MADNVYLFYGNDEYLVGLNARKRVDEICPEAEQALSLEVIDGNAAKIDDAVTALDQCIAAFRTVGLFGGKKVAWFRDVSFFKNAVIMKNEQVKRLFRMSALGKRDKHRGTDYRIDLALRKIRANEPVPVDLEAMEELAAQVATAPQAPIPAPSHSLAPRLEGPVTGELPPPPGLVGELAQYICGFHAIRTLSPR